MKRKMAGLSSLLVGLCISSQCKCYQQGELTGSVCKPLCDSKEITYLNSLRNGKNKVAVILAKWGQKKVVLKATKLSKVVNTALGQFLDMKVDEKVSISIRHMLLFCIAICMGNLIPNCFI